MSSLDPDSAARRCSCRQLDQFKAHVQSSEWDRAAELMDDLHSCCDWLTVVVDQGNVDQQWEQVVHLLKRGSVTDSQLMDAIKSAVYFQIKTLFSLMIRDIPRACRVFKQKFAHQQWKEDHTPLLSDDDVGEVGEVAWIYDVLCEEGHKDLALFVATSVKSSISIITDFCWEEWEHFDPKKKKFQNALTNLLEIDEESYLNFVSEKYMISKATESERSFLFRHTIRCGKHELILDLCRYGVSRKDLKFAFWWLVQGNVNDELFNSICSKLDQTEKDWIRRYSLKCSMEKYFKERSATSRKTFVKQFYRCSDESFANQIFQKAITKCLKLNCVECFAMLCTYHESVTDQADPHVASALIWCHERRFAFTSAIEGNQTAFISKVCENLSAEQDSFSKAVLLHLLCIMIKKEAWHLLICLSKALRDIQFFYEVFGLLETRDIVHKLLDPSVWADISAALDLWIRHCDLQVVDVESVVNCAKKTLRAFPWHVDNASKLKQRCVDNGHSSLAFVLALATRDWVLLTTLVNTLSLLEVHHNLLWSVVEAALEKRKVSIAVKVLRVWPVSRDSILTIFVSHEDMEPCNVDLAALCERKGLVHWALVLKADSPDYILRKHHLCQNAAVLEYLLQEAAEQNAWKVVEALVPRVSHPELLGKVLKNAIRWGQLSVAERAIGSVDPTISCDSSLDSESESDFDDDSNKTMLFEAVDSNKEVRVDMVNLCLSAGVASFEREKNPPVYQCPLIEGLTTHISDLKIIKLLLASGAISHQRLHEIREDDDLQEWLHRGRECKKQMAGYRCIVEAAGIPSRLEHLARLAVSHCIGCRPGRSDRINSLPVPEPIKDLLNFKDIVSMDLSVEEEES